MSEFNSENIDVDMFPAKHHTLSRLNKSLCIILAGLMFIMLISYYILTTGEVTLTKLGAETMVLNTENVELQNKLDNLMSYNNVEQLVRGNNMLDSARQVIEIQAVTTLPAQKPLPKAVGIKKYYRWSLGF